jgi:hypothetical protein
MSYPPAKQPATRQPGKHQAVSRATRDGGLLGWPAKNHGVETQCPEKPATRRPITSQAVSRATKDGGIFERVSLRDGPTELVEGAEVEDESCLRSGSC